VEETPSYTITFYEMLVAFLFLSVVLFLQGQFTPDLIHMRWSDFWWLLFLGTLCTSFAFLATIEVVKRLGAFTVSLSINLEPVYTIILAIFLLKENELLGRQFYIGAVIIVLVVLANVIIKYVLQKKSIES
jgi:drug/metabolite transporter (DMT)-like permease